MVVIRTARGGGRFEKVGSYVRARRVGPFVFVAGTTAVEPSGKLHAPWDAYAQTHYILDRIEQALREVGASLADVVRTRAFFSDIAAAGGDFIRAHGERFREIEPVLTGVEAGLTVEGMMVEIEVDALLIDELGS
jgi:enamine deaminase RidA (YjgF/YER057c/UK114 family)